MSALSKCVNDYLKRILTRKLRFIPAAAVFLFLFSLSCVFLYDGINKTFLIYTILCLVTGGLIVFPRPEKSWLRWLFLLLYILIIPRKMFQRMEIPVHDMTGLLKNAEFINILILLLIWAFFLLLFRRIHLALGGSSILLLLLLLLNHYCFRSHGTTFSIYNLKNLKNALFSLINGSQPIMTRELWYSILYFAFFIAFGFWCSAPALKKPVSHLAATLIPLGCFAAFFCFWNFSDLQDNAGLTVRYENTWEAQLRNGFLVSFFTDIAKPGTPQVKWYEGFPVVCHALGITEDGAGGTNSRDALEYSYSLGQRVFETDIAIASDNVPVLRHDWDIDLGQEDGFGWTEDSHPIPTSSEFLQVPIYGKYTPMTLLDLYRVMYEREDMYVIIDPKYNSDVVGQFTILVNTALDNGYEEVLHRIVVQLYYEEMYDYVESVYHFDNYLYTLYYIGYPGSDSIGAFCRKNNIPVVVMPYRSINAAYCRELHDYSLRVYGHTVMDSEDAQQMISLGADGIYSENILPTEMRTWMVQ